MISLPSYHPVAEDDLIRISSNSLDPVALLSRAHHPRAGAVVLFSGEVRNNNSGKAVAYLEYEAHVSMASKMIDLILLEAKAKWSLNIALAQHRIGKVEVGDSAVVVITSSAHRKEAYATNRFIIDKIKHEVPIWKCEYFADGTKEWGGRCGCESVVGSRESGVGSSESGGERKL
jgi:molybdopterin synthase catalytic subunit